MWLSAGLIVFTLWILRKLFLPQRPRGDLNRIPGPPSTGFLAGLLTFNQGADRSRRHVLLGELSQKYGPIIRITTPASEVIIVSDYEGIHKVLIGSAKDFGGRPNFFRLREITKETGILFSSHADATWKDLRKASQRHLKQFGDGLSRLETIITDVAEDMFQELSQQIGKPFDPKSVIFDTALNSIAFLISGVRTRSGDPIIEMIREHHNSFSEFASVVAPWKLRILDIWPGLRYFGVPGWKMIQRFQELQNNIWQNISDMDDGNPDAHSLCRILKANISSSSQPGDGFLTNTDAKQASLQLVTAGVATTSKTFYGGFNLLAHHPAVQTKLFAEITAITGGTRDVALRDRPKMHYARAIVLEFLRYISVAPLGVGHSTVISTMLKGYSIPPGTTVFVNLYAIHHDEKTWGDPFEFRPERFLDENGELVPADHPHRKNLMPFGAGLCVCLGESLALTRLFLWTTSLVQRFTVRPAEGNNKKTTDSKLFKLEGLLQPTPYEIVLDRR